MLTVYTVLIFDKEIPWWATRTISNHQRFIADSWTDWCTANILRTASSGVSLVLWLKKSTTA